jgi:hypothetical protein
MPRFYLDIRTNGVLPQMTVLPDLETARTEATRALREMAKAATKLPVAFGAVIRDENFEPVCEVESVVRAKRLSNKPPKRAQS